MEIEDEIKRRLREIMHEVGELEELANQHELWTLGDYCSDVWAALHRLHVAQA